MLKSSKIVGRYEDAIITPLEKHYTINGYDAHPHCRLNCAWSNIISDIDLLARKNEEVIIIEVKSHHDKFQKAFSQLNKYKNIATKLFIATNMQPTPHTYNNWLDDDIGLIYVTDNNKITIIKDAKIIINENYDVDLNLIKKTCLLYFLDKNYDVYDKKQKLINAILDSVDHKTMRKKYLNVIYCKNGCECNAKKCDL